jgi:Tol biopolymer transport system component
MRSSESVASSTQVPTATFPSMPEGKIVFSRNINGHNELVLTNTDGSDIKHLADSAPYSLDAWGVTLSPDGERVAFAVSQNGAIPEETVAMGIYIMALDGSKLMHVSGKLKSAVSPAWSPDGSQIVLSGTQRLNGDWDIYSIRIHGGDLLRLASYPANDVHPIWSPDGRYIAFLSKYMNDPYRGDLYIVMADGSEQPQLIANQANEEYAWSPDSTSLAFTSAKDGNDDIYLINFNGNVEIRLTNSVSSDGQPEWAPNGQRIAFTSERNGNYDIFVTKVDGSEQRSLVANSANDILPIWSLDSKYIFFASGLPDNWSVYAIMADGGNLTLVAKSLSIPNFSIWFRK